MTTKTKTRQAIDAPRRSIFLEDPENIVIIGLDTKDGPSHPRYDVRAHETFKENIVIGMMKHGVKKPISVIKVNGRLEVVDGRQRVINAREANRRLKAAGEPPLRVPVLPPEQGTDAKMAALMAMLNTHNVEMSPLALGQMAQGLYDRGYADEEVAVYCNVSVQTVKNYVSLLGLKPEIQQMMITGKLPATKGYELARKDDKAQKAFLTRLETGSRSGPPKRRPSAEALRKLVDENKLPKLFLMGLKYALGDIESVADLDFSTPTKAEPSIPLPAKKGPQKAEPVSKAKLALVKPEPGPFKVEQRTVKVDGKEQHVEVKVFPTAKEHSEEQSIHVTSYGKPGEA